MAAGIYRHFDVTIAARISEKLQVVFTEAFVKVKKRDSGRMGCRLHSVGRFGKGWKGQYVDVLDLEAVVREKETKLHFTPPLNLPGLVQSTFDGEIGIVKLCIEKFKGG